MNRALTELEDDIDTLETKIRTSRRPMAKKRGTPMFNGFVVHKGPKKGMFILRPDGQGGVNRSYLNMEQKKKIRYKK